ncbi:hypothetical protein ACLQ20_11950 [Micromonospora sp. DT46]|uniref:hypothetical protein n=1 Tax=Micromonospora sp. DT46 TaxID=3393435 RepID=UPI003CF2A299
MVAVVRADVEAGEGVTVGLDVHRPAGEWTGSERAVVAGLDRGGQLDVEHLGGDELADVTRPRRSPGERRDPGVQLVAIPQQRGQLAQGFGHEVDSSRCALAWPVTHR